MRNILQVIAGLVLAALLFVGYQTWQWKRATEARLATLTTQVGELQKSADAYRWLSEPVLTLQDGRKVNRAQLLDLLLSKALQPKVAKK